METSKILQSKTAYIFILSAALVCFSFILQGNIDFSLGDEGSLWYGAIYTARGQIPGVDFLAYDPGRYYWIMPLFLFLGQGVMALRLSVATFQFVGLTLGLLAVQRVVKSWWGLIVVGLLLLAWMVPRQKLFESSLAMMAVYFAVRLVEHPTSRNAFIAGVFVGLAAFLGRNHGVYSFLAFLLLFLYIGLKLKQGLLFKKLGLWLAGIVIGYAPMLFMLAFAPGMLDRTFRRVISPVAKKGITNVPIPVPWPWTIDYAHQSLLNSLSDFLIGICFVGLPLFYLFVVISLFLTKPGHIPGRSLLIASASVGIFYMHHAFSRADLAHLAQSIHPFLLGLIAVPYAYSFYQRKKTVFGLAVLMAIVTIFAVVIPANLYWQRLSFRERFVLYELKGEQIWLRKGEAAYIEIIKQLVGRHLKSHEKLLITGTNTGLYPILNRQSPIRETYFITPSQPGREDEIIQTLADQEVNWVLLVDSPFDRRAELRFRYTHPHLWQYFTTAFEPIQTPGLPPDQQLLHRKRDTNDDLSSLPWR